MTLKSIHIDLPADILLALNESEQELQQQIKYAIAIRLYIQQKVTLGKATQIAGLTRLQFEDLLAENKVPISNLGFEDVLSDLSKLQ